MYGIWCRGEREDGDRQNRENARSIRRGHTLDRKTKKPRLEGKKGWKTMIKWGFEGTLTSPGKHLRKGKKGYSGGISISRTILLLEGETIPPEGKKTLRESILSEKAVLPLHPTKRGRKNDLRRGGGKKKKGVT